MSQEDPKIEIVFDLQGGNAGLTEEFIYENQPSTDGESIEILSSATVDSNRMGVINKNAKLQGEKLKTFSAPCILVARNDFAGTMKYIETGNFTINDHAYVMTLRPNWKEKVNLRWFAFQYQELFNNLVTSKSDNATFSKEYAERQKVQLPDKTIQDRIAAKLYKLEQLEEKIELIYKDLNLISQLKFKQLPIAYQDKIISIFNIDGGNSGLTEEFVYKNQSTSLADSIQIMSGATIASNELGSVLRTATLSNGRDLKIFSGPAILVIRKGLAGSMKYIPNGEFTTNDDAYVMTLKPTWKEKVNLRWFAFQYQELFNNLVTSKSDNATFSKEYAERQKVQLPDISIQDRIVDKLDIIDVKMKELDKVKAEIVMRRQSKIVG